MKDGENCLEGRCASR